LHIAAANPVQYISSAKQTLIRFSNERGFGEVNQDFLTYEFC